MSRECIRSYFISESPDLHVSEGRKTLPDKTSSKINQTNEGIDEPTKEYNRLLHKFLLLVIYIILFSMFYQSVIFKN